MKEHEWRRKSEAVATRERHGGGWKQDVTCLLPASLVVLAYEAYRPPAHTMLISASGIGALDSGAFGLVSSNHIMCDPWGPARPGGSSDW